MRVGVIGSAIALAIAVQCAWAGPGAVLVNGDFEQGKVGQKPAHWGTPGWDRDGRVVRYLADAGRGNHALKLVNGGNSWVLAYQTLKLKPQTRYQLTWRAKTSGATGGALDVVSYPPDGDPFHGTDKTHGMVGHRFSRAMWTDYNCEFTTHSDPTHTVAIKLFPSAWRFKGSHVLYDDLVLTELGPDIERDDSGGTVLRNLVANGGFEFGLQDWHPSRDTTLARTYALDDADPHEGRYCLVRTDTAYVASPNFHTAPGIVSNWAYAEPGHHYYLSGL